MLSQLETLLRGAVADPLRPLSELPLLSSAEAWQMVGEWNAAGWAGAAAGEGTLYERFLARAQAHPAATALVFKEERLSYGELAGRANAWAHRLRVLGVGAETRVALLLERSPEAVAALLAILAAGGAYVPLDPGYPEEGLRLLLAGAGWSARGARA